MLINTNDSDKPCQEQRTLKKQRLKTSFLEPKMQITNLSL